MQKYKETIEELGNNYGVLLKHVVLKRNVSADAMRKTPPNFFACGRLGLRRTSGGACSGRHSLRHANFFHMHVCSCMLLQVHTVENALTQQTKTGAPDFDIGEAHEQLAKTVPAVLVPATFAEIYAAQQEEDAVTPRAAAAARGSPGLGDLTRSRDFESSLLAHVGRIADSLTQIAHRLTSNPNSVASALQVLDAGEANGDEEQPRKKRRKQQPQTEAAAAATEEAASSSSETDSESDSALGLALEQSAHEAEVAAGAMDIDKKQSAAAASKESRTRQTQEKMLKALAKQQPRTLGSAKAKSRIRRTQTVSSD